MSISDFKPNPEFRLPFIPTGRTIVEPIGINDAVGLAIQGEPSTGADAYINIKTGEFRLVTYGTPPADSKAAAMFLKAADALYRALRVGQITAHAIVGGETFRVPKGYWSTHSRGCETVMDRPGVPADLVGSPIVVDPASLESWEAIAVGTNNSTRSAVPLSAGVHGGQWSHDKPSNQQVEVFKFFGFTKGHFPGGHEEKWSKQRLRREYGDWHGKDRRKSSPYARTGFEKMVDRYLDGWRIEDGKWIEPQ